MPGSDPRRDPERGPGRGDPEHQDGAGVPDGFERLWTPHRMAYIKGEGKPGDDATSARSAASRG